MTIIEYENLSELEHKKQSMLRQQVKAKIIEHTDIPAFAKIKADNIYFEITDTGYKMRPIYIYESDKQEWQDIQSSFEEEEARDILISILEQLTNFDIPAQVINNGKSITKANEIVEADYVSDKESVNEESLIKSVPYAEYINDCHSYVSYIPASKYLCDVGLYLYIDKLQIGYDIKTKEITLPLNGVKGSRYFSIRLNFDHAADEEEAQKVLQYYNLKPNETAKWNLYKDTEGKLINGGKNYDDPYSELGKKIIFKEWQTAR